MLYCSCMRWLSCGDKLWSCAHIKGHKAPIVKIILIFSVSSQYLQLLMLVWPRRTCNNPVQAVKTHSPLPPLIFPINLSLFPVTSKTFPQLPHGIPSVTLTVSSAPVMRKLCRHDRKKAEDESVTYHPRELLFALQRTLLINDGPEFKQQRHNRRMTLRKHGSAEGCWILSVSNSSNINLKALFLTTNILSVCFWVLCPTQKY